MKTAGLTLCYGQKGCFGFNVVSLSLVVKLGSLMCPHLLRCASRLMAGLLGMRPFVEVKEFGSRTLSCETTGQLTSLGFPDVNYSTVLFSLVAYKGQTALQHFWCHAWPYDETLQKSQISTMSPLCS